MSSKEEIVRYNTANPRTRISAKVNEKSLMLSIAGPLEHQSAADLMPVFSSLDKDLFPGASLYVDLSAVNYISSTGVGALSSAMIQSERCGIAFILIRVPGSILKVLNVLGLISYFKIEDGTRL